MKITYEESDIEGGSKWTSRIWLTDHTYMVYIDNNMDGRGDIYGLIDLDSGYIVKRPVSAEDLARYINHNSLKHV